MELVILGIVNVVLLVLLLAAFKLIRTGSNNRPSAVPDGAADADRAIDVGRVDDTVIDLRETTTPPPVVRPLAPDVHPSVPDAPEVPTMPVYRDPVFAADGTPLPEGAFEEPNRTDVAPAPPPVGSSTPLTSLSRSAIVIDSTMNGSGPTPSELLFSVIETLGGIGFELTMDSPDYGLLRDADDNTASIDLTKRPNGTDRIAIAVDSPRAVEALAMLEIWHRSRLGATDQVRLTARIR